jgi:YHS domain-containing protein
MGHGHRRGQNPNEPDKTGNPQLRWVPPTKDVDPVCSKTVATDMAKPSVYAGNVYYFCSRECREAFEVAPDLYIGGDVSHQASEHSHA